MGREDRKSKGRSYHPKDVRTSSQHDRDRVLHAGVFRRLAGVTQVAGPFENYIFHTRLTHSLEVAQIARRLAERLRVASDTPKEALPDIDPDVVEAAALIHDIGHPPFGHVAENELDRLALLNGCVDGFEGNAQSFRIVTRLAAHTISSPSDSQNWGLNLTRATLNAALKYPWLRDLHRPGSHHYIKFGAYIEDQELFKFARKDIVGDKQSLEAQIMDYADDVAYSIYDIFDFYAAGLLPLDSLVHYSDEYRRFIELWKKETHYIPPTNLDEQEVHFKTIISDITFLAGSHYDGSYNQRVLLKELNSRLITDFIIDISVIKDPSTGLFKLNKDPARISEIALLKQIVWRYVICNPRLATQQEGHKKAIQVLFETYSNAVTSKNNNLIPNRFNLEVNQLSTNEKDQKVARLAIDIIASLTDSQAISMYKRVTGIELGAISDLISY